ncbi:MAG TPA: outer membrane beta-barrel protein [Verrucomicrobium sp.]|nr:outer membrane beta-barrel protein [Verrucomicrobium sp.]
MKASSLILPLAGTLLLASPFSWAGTPTTSEKAIILPASPPEDDGWYFTVAVYSWLSAVDGTTGIGPLSVSADTSVADALDELDFTYMSYFEVGKGRWSVGLDGIYAKLSDDNNFSLGPVRGSADIEQEQATITARLQYTIHKSEACKVDLFAGVRWTYIDVDTDINTNLGPGRTFGITRDWFDPIVGFRSTADLGGKWYLQVMADIGGFGVESDLTWQALAGFGYRFTKHVNGLIGYRALSVDYDKDGFKLDTTSYGPILGLSYTF